MSFAYDGGPALADVRDARLVGLVSTDVAEVRADEQRSSSQVILRNASIGYEEYQAFGHRITRLTFVEGSLRRLCSL